MSGQYTAALILFLSWAQLEGTYINQRKRKEKAGPKDKKKMRLRQTLFFILLNYVGGVST